jgi:stress response protein YsnF
MEEVEIERVAVNRVIDEAVPVRYEGDTTIISLLEEVLVVEKRLVLREEIHIKKLRKEVHNPQEVLLREEQVEIVRTAGNDPQYRPDKAQDR